VDFTLRPLRPEDLAAVHALQRRVEQHDGFPLATPLAEFEEWLDDPHLDLAIDTRLVETGGEIVAWGRIWHIPSGEREERAYVLGAVDPAHRRKGIGSALLTWLIDRAEERLRAAPGNLPLHVRTNAFDFQRGALDLYARHGLVPVRYNDELLRDLEAIPPRPRVPGVEIVPWDPARSEEARLAENEAFADHWGSTPRDPAAWEHELGKHGRRLDLSFLALDGGRIVATCRNGFFPADEGVTGRREGWVMSLSVVRSHRRRGIASALLVASLEAFKSAGMTHSALGVDSENPTGAYGVYERLGYRPIYRLVVCQRTA
jgi:ribosomal protein S18 acetylase RimI-like enzyme